MHYLKNSFIIVTYIHDLEMHLIWCSVKSFMTLKESLVEKGRALYDICKSHLAQIII